MRKLLWITPLVLGVAVAPVLAGGECCKKAEADNGWCKHCNVGYAFGVPIQMIKLHGALIGMPTSDKCPGCVKAAITNGTCDHCKVAIANGKAFRSRYAHAIAMGTRMDSGSDMCEGCAKGAKSGEYTWCDHCKVGIVSGYLFKDKEQYDDAVKAIAIIKNASDSKCELCAVGMVTDGTCDHCKVSYKDGKVSET